ncbi:MAG TPA: histone deacetylase [Steroidobacteraceae bacterium]|nr:histone deacetylase [Steroidobacteraceae bacterium]
MKIVYRPEYNIDLGLLNRLHPFDGRKYAKVFEALAATGTENVVTPVRPVDDAVINAFVNELMKRVLKAKRYILQALEVPYIPLLPFSWIDKRILLPMRWAVADTIKGAELALAGTNRRNLSGGYHHASRKSAQGFCIYNDIGIAYDQMMAAGRLSANDRVLIIDIDAHHGNGNAEVFLENRNVVLLDVYNADIYPQTNYTRERVDLAVPLASGTRGDEYLQKLGAALRKLDGNFRLAFVVAGTDVLATDPLGRLGLTIDECAERERLVEQRLSALSIPALFVAGGGYSADSSRAMTASIAAGLN